MTTVSIFVNCGKHFSMSQNLHEYRKSYEKGELSQENASKNPFEQFQNWFEFAEQSGEVDEVNAMTLTTIGIDGFPRGRVVLLKEFSEKGFILYTNYDSEKGVSIKNNPNVCISFFWPTLERQIIIKGIAEKISEEKSTEYFHSRPKGSQLGALVSEQSKKIINRKILEENLKALEEKFQNKVIPRPINWGGYIIAPIEFEFWQGRKNRLHDRIQYQKDGNNWKTSRLQP